METRREAPQKRAMNIFINNRQVASRLDICATAAGQPGKLAPTDKHGMIDGLNQAVDLVFNDLRPQNGVIAVRFVGVDGAEAIVSAMEVGAGPGGQGMKPISAANPPPAKSTPKSESYPE
jgi:hypothetical protein